MNIKKTTIFSAVIIAICALTTVACERDNVSEKNGTSPVSGTESKSPIRDGIYTGEYKRDNSSTVHFAFTMERGELVNVSAKDENGMMVLPDDAVCKGPIHNSISAYETFIDMCMIDNLPCVAIIPTRTPDLNNGGQPKDCYFVMGCGYNKDGNCWYNENTTQQ